MHDLPESELRETLQQLRDTEQVLKLAESAVGTDVFPGLVAAIEGRRASATAIANEMGTDLIFLGMMLQEKTRPQVLQIVQQTLARGEKILADKIKPDDREELLAGGEFGVVFMPPELLRQLWGLGEAVVHFEDGEAESKRVEPRAINVMMLAAQWVRDARNRWGLSDRVEKVNVAPLLKEPPGEPPF